MFQELSRLIGSTQLRTTAYHLAANGMVERFHRQLKAAITCHADDSWIDSLPAVLLGIRAAWKEDLWTTPAELVYSKPIRLPGEFLAKQSTTTTDRTSCIVRLRCYFGNLRPTPATRHGERRTFVFKDLATCLHVFVRHDAMKGSLQPAYDGPFEVVNRYARHFDVQVRGRIVPVSVDRIKPTYTFQTDDHDDRQTTAAYDQTNDDRDDTLTTAPAPTTRVTRSGRRVHFPDFYSAGSLAHVHSI